MEVCFITEDSVNAVWQNKLGEIEKSDLLVFGFNGLGLVSYKKELSGETEYLHDLAKLSKQLSRVIISGCDTENYGVYRHSAVVADCGKILGVSDMVHAIDESEFVSGGGFRVYDTSAGKIGVLICEDLYFPEAIRVLALCDADIIVCIFKKIENSMPILLLRTGAFANGAPLALCASKYHAVADIRGKIISAGCKNISKADIKIEKDYHLISSRKRGYYKDFNSGY